MTLANINTTTALAIIPKETKARKSAETRPADKNAASDKVDIRSYDGDHIPSDDDGPGAGGGYKPAQDPAEGPGAGGGYDPDEIPADDDGHSEPTQDPAESDGPGAGGGYLTISGASTSLWNQPLTVYSTLEGVNSYSPDFAPPWVEVLPQNAYSWTGNGLLLVDGPTEKAVPDQAVDDKKPAQKKSSRSKKA